MGRVFLFLTSILVTLGVGLGENGRPSVVGAQDDGVYQIQDRQGRKVYTNLQGLASHGTAQRRLSLPPLSSIDFAKAQPEDLRTLDDQVREYHGAMQEGERCEAIRKTSRTPDRSRLWKDHGLKISVAGGLLVFAALLAVSLGKRRLGSLFPFVPIAGAAFLGYATFRDIRAARDLLTAGLRACSEQLPDGAPENRVAVEQRLTKALDLQRIINASYERQAIEIEQAMRERF